MTYHDSKPANFSDLVGKILTKITDCEVGSESVEFECADGTEFIMYSNAECCALCTLNDISGDLSDLIGSPLLQAEKSTNCDNPPHKDSDSWTWTFYKLATIKGYVTLRWLGESNGYYSEEVAFEMKLPKAALAAARGETK